MEHKKEVKCPYCSQRSKNIIKKGIRKKKQQSAQQYYCKDCDKFFTDAAAKHKTYPAKIILNAVSYYNLGYTQEQASSLISQRFKVKLPQKTISNWINEYKQLCTFSKLRKQAKKLCTPKNIIKKQTLSHIQPYTFKYHKAKLEILFKNIKYNNQFTNSSQFYWPLKNYLEKITAKEFPHHIFKQNQSCPTAEIANNRVNDLINNKNNSTSARDRRAAMFAIKEANKTITTEAQSSDTDIAKIKNNGNKKVLEQRASLLKFSHLKINHISKTNLANKLAKLALNLSKTNKDKHQAIQNFFLVNDSTTIAVEVPVYLTNWDAGYFRNQRGFIFPLKDYKTPITGHIDILQIRNGLLYILDYKPEAENQNPAGQLAIYALALSRKLNLPLYYFKCAWFDENNYFEFFPLHAVYEKLKLKEKSEPSPTRSHAPQGTIILSGGFTRYYKSELSFSQMGTKKIREKTTLDGLNRQLPVLFIKSYQKLVKNSISANKVKGCAKLIRKCNFAANFLASHHHFDCMNITNKLGRNSLKNTLFAIFNIQTNKPANAAAKDRNTGSRIHYSRSIDPFVILNYSYWNYWIVRSTKQLIRKFHNILISSSFLGTFITMTLSKEIPFFLSSASTSDAESPETTMPLLVIATHLPLYFSPSSGCDDNHSSSFMFFTPAYFCNELQYINFTKENQEMVGSLIYTKHSNPELRAEKDAEIAKSEAENQNPAGQLAIYALALSRKLNLPLYYFKCAWFDENNYFEFFPLHAVYKKRRAKWTKRR